MTSTRKNKELLSTRERLVQDYAMPDHSHKSRDEEEEVSEGPTPRYEKKKLSTRERIVHNYVAAPDKEEDDHEATTTAAITRRERLIHNYALHHEEEGEHRTKWLVPDCAEEEEAPVVVVESGTMGTDAIPIPGLAVHRSHGGDEAEPRVGAFFVPGLLRPDDTDPEDPRLPAERDGAGGTVMVPDPEILHTYVGAEEDDDLSEAHLVEDDPFNEIRPTAERLFSNEALQFEARAARSQMQRAREMQWLCLATVIALVSLGTAAALLVVFRKKDLPGGMSTAPVEGNALDESIMDDSIEAYSFFSWMHEISSEQSFRFPDTPQSRAFKWITMDPFLSNYSSWRIKQRYILATFFYSMDGDNWYRKTNWLDHSVHECEWYTNSRFNPPQTQLLFGLDAYLSSTAKGMKDPPCGGTDDIRYPDEPPDSFKFLFLVQNRLKGSLPPEIFKLASIRGINLSLNPDLSGIVPAEIGLLTSMQSVCFLKTPNLAGTIPTQIGLMPTLTDFILFESHVAGTLPSEIGLLADSLETLAWYHSDTTLGMQGTIPTQVGALTQLKVVFLAVAQLSGTIPTQLGALVNLISFDLSKNKVTGHIPSEFGMLTNMNQLRLDHNALTGPIPSELGLMTGLTVGTFHDNALEGTLATEIGLMTTLGEFFADGNMLSGPMPSELGRLSHLQFLYLYDNAMSGLVPSEVGSLVSLHSLKLSKNGWNSPIPSELGLLSSLTTLQCSVCGLKGTIPTELGSLTDVGRLVLSFNSLSGTIPSQLGRLDIRDWGYFELGVNQLTGCIPSQLALLTGEIRGFALHENNLSGTIPTQLGQMTTVEQLFLHNNYFSGSLPSEMGLMMKLNNLFVRNNKLTGLIPSELGLLMTTAKDFFSLMLDNNNLTGTIPLELDKSQGMKDGSLIELSLTNNSLLSGTIPDGLCSSGKGTGKRPQVHLSFDCGANLCGCSWCPC